MIRDASIQCNGRDVIPQVVLDLLKGAQIAQTNTDQGIGTLLISRKFYQVLCKKMDLVIQSGPHPSTCFQQDPSS